MFVSSLFLHTCIRSVYASALSLQRNRSLDFNGFTYFQPFLITKTWVSKFYLYNSMYVCSESEHCSSETKSGPLVGLQKIQNCIFFESGSNDFE
jgi:hypothetical protein